jgi:uncharacterized Zn-binding protein involved in type VI secretion
MTVFANGMEISAKAQGCKVIAAFPDVCFTPPQTPATPPGVPIPYPNFGLDSDLTSGSSTVKIGGETISLENKSHYSKCSGDEAGCAPKKGVVTSKNTGKVYAQAWSSDVKVEGKGVARFGDMATSNHGSNTGDTPPMVIVGKPGMSPADCAKLLASLGLSVHKHGDADDNCNYAGNAGKSGKKYDASKPTQESDHVPQATCFTTGDRNSPGMEFPKGTYDVKKAPCVCLEDSKRLATEHGRKSEMQRFATTEWKNKKAKNPSWNPTYADAKKADLDAIQWAKSPKLEPDAKGNPHPALKCLEDELDKYFRDELGMDETTPVAIPDQEYTPAKMVERQAKFDTAGMKRFSKLSAS